jgi:uncharacterized membrane protein YraQ (UPF0718 family)
LQELNGGIALEAKLSNAIVIFISIFWEAMPFIVLGAIIAGILEELVPQRIIAKLIPRSRLLAIAIGGLLGLLFPMCECGIITVMRRLLRKGVPLSACVCYMLAGPIINVVVMLSTWVAFSGNQQRIIGPQVPQIGGSGMLEPHQLPAAQTAQIGGFGMMALRMGLGYLVAILVSCIVEWQYRKHGNRLLTPLAQPPADKTGSEEDEEEKPEARKPFFQRLSKVCETALHDTVDITVYLLLGAFLAALTRMMIDQNQIAALARQYPGFAILIMMGLAILLCICSEADAFVAASFGFMPPSARLAFLVLGPMLDLKLYVMYTRVFRTRLIWTIILSVVVLVFVVSCLFHFSWEEYHTLLQPAAEAP